MTFVEPQLARPFTIEKFNKKPQQIWKDWFMEPKHDGMRALVYVGKDEVEVYSRSGKVYATHVPELVASLSYLPAGTIIDGELAVIDGWHDQMYWAGQPLGWNGPSGQAVFSASARVPIVNFNKTMRIMGTGWEKAVDRQNPDSENFVGKMSFIGFDVIQYEHVSIQGNPQWMRSVSLNTLASSLNDPNFVMNPRLPVDLTVYDALVEAGIEGVILKSQNGHYGSGRSSDWLKLKSEKTFDVVVMGFTDAKEGKTGKFAGKIGAIEFGAYLPDGTLNYVGRCSGMDDATRDEWTKIRDNGPDLKNLDVIEVKANELVGSGEYRTPRHPQYVTKRIDKDAKDCKMEQFKP